MAEFEDTAPDVADDDAETAGLSGPKDTLRGRDLDKAVDSERRKSGEIKPDNIRATVEEAVAQQRIRRGDQAPYRSGYGLTGKRNSEMIEFERLAKRNGTSVPKAIRDYKAIEDAGRRDPLLGVEAYAKRMGWDSQKVAGHWATQHGYFKEQGYEPSRNIGAEADEHNSTAAMQALIDHEASHPQNAYLKDPEFIHWAIESMAELGPDGRTASQWMLEKIPDPRQRLAFVANAYQQRRRQQMATEKEDARQAAMDNAAAREKAIYSRMGR